ncbi:MAG: sigma-70 family RNA polymerase sigma factor [Nitrospirales bacterium]|nr:sigma-70 family RNA polymerase sigma factor [Nitrospira sp.]MDR4503037.1 sigma-70 family RNA polymerase sigma factor [Nitrospirales bacterium]
MNVLSQIGLVFAMASPGAKQDESRLLEALRNGDERAFMQVVDEYSNSLLRVAMAYVPSRAVAEEVVQETWMGVLAGLPRFEGRSSFKTWLFTILTNRAKTRGQRESRYMPFPEKGKPEDGDEGQGVDVDAFIQTGSKAGHWITPPHAWDHGTPERLALSKESREQIERAIAALPDTQRQVMTLRDLEGMSSGEVCNILGVTETNQRVLLHRARTRVRKALAQYIEGRSGQ